LTTTSCGALPSLRGASHLVADFEREHARAELIFEAFPVWSVTNVIYDVAISAVAGHPADRGRLLTVRWTRTGPQTWGKGTPRPSLESHPTSRGERSSRFCRRRGVLVGLVASAADGPNTHLRMSDRKCRIVPNS
jgi:hypothetical protein